ncbi:MAG TPA: peptidoglycan editing factor PgeF [Dermatophilaceae bacterium]|nr:peptidoglycan editing factor PgeF [Dermatophilaceae bacterium]
MIRWQAQRGSIGYAVTDRLGGVSAAPHDSCNLATHVADRPDDVATNRRRVAEALSLDPARIVYMDQVHGREVTVVDGPVAAPVPCSDALVTRTPGLALAALVADCVPILLADPSAGVVAAVHSGRPGFLAGIIDRAVDAMRDLGADVIEAVVGPSICGRCYEVPADMAAAGAAVSAASWAVSWTGTPAMDVASGVVARLADRGVAVTWLPGCSREDATLYSYRRDGSTGRYAGLVWLSPPSHEGEAS